MTDTQEHIAQVCDEIKELLITKNEAYGDSALDPVRIFASSDPIEQIKVRIDDKISRISRGKNKDRILENDLHDLIGYLVLLDVAQRKVEVPKPEPFRLTFFRTPKNETIDISDYISVEGLSDFSF